MLYALILLISVCASLVGAICGVGGGIIIKPVLDSFGLMSVAAVSFLSGCTVLTMTLYSVIRCGFGGKSQINIPTSTALAVGAVIGGILGKALFQHLWNSLGSINTAGLIQAICLLTVTAAALIYTIYMKKIKTRHIKNLYVTALLGLSLGVISSFLGIGGGPINLVILYFFFSMETKPAAINSLFIILFSQAASLMSALLAGTVPPLNPVFLLLMITGGLAGAIAGRQINKKILPTTVSKLFIVLMTVIIFVNLYNIFRFSS